MCKIYLNDNCLLDQSKYLKQLQLEVLFYQVLLQSLVREVYQIQVQ
jgi:hypothetical protein